MPEQRVVPEQRMGEAGPDGRVREQEAAARLRRRRLRKRTLAAAVATAAAAGGTAALLVAHAGHPPTAFTTVTSALARTSADSYSFALHATVRFGGKQVRSDVASGAYDSRHRLGAELLVAAASRGSPVRMQVRFAGRYVFTQIAPGSGFGKPWNKSPIPSAGVAAMPPNDVYGIVTDRPAGQSG